MKKIFFTILLINFVLISYAQQSYPVKNVNGNNYYEYTVEAGDGLYSISKKFGVSQTDLHNANINLTTNIKAGQKILIPIKKTVVKENNTNKTITHIVEPKQTLYALSRLYNVSVDQIIKLNPGAENGIKIGQELIISKEENKNIEGGNNSEINTIKHLVQKKETLYSISKRYNVAIHNLIKDNPELENGLKAGSTIIIHTKIKNADQLNQENADKKKENKPIKPKKKIKENKRRKEKEQINDLVSQVMQGHFIAQTDSLNSDSTKIHKDNSILNIVYLLPLNSISENESKKTDRFVEFYRGSLLALEEAKRSGLTANVFTFDTGKSTERVIDLLSELDSIDADVIIGPAYSNQIDTVIAYAKSKDIVSVIPFSSKITSEYYYPKLIQFNPPQDELFNSILKNTFEPVKRKYIIGRFENSYNKGNVLADELCKLLSENGVGYRNIIIKPNEIDSIVKTITPDSTLFMLASTSITDVAPILDSLSQYRLPKVSVWGFEEWGTNLIKKYPRTLYYSLFNPQPSDIYIESYQKWYGVYKQSVGVKYDLIGYDLTSLTISNLIMGDNDLTLDITPYNEFMQSYPDFKFIDNRWVNTNYYLFYWDNTTIKSINK